MHFAHEFRPCFSDARYPGLIDRGLPVLAADERQLAELHRRASETGIETIAFPAAGQRTTDYETFRRAIRETAPADLTYLGVLLCVSKRAVNRLVGDLPLLR